MAPEKHRAKHEACSRDDSKLEKHGKAKVQLGADCESKADCKEEKKSARCNFGHCTYDDCYEDKDCGGKVCERYDGSGVMLGHPASRSVEAATMQESALRAKLAALRVVAPRPIGGRVSLARGMSSMKWITVALALVAACASDRDALDNKPCATCDARPAITACGDGFTRNAEGGCDAVLPQTPCGEAAIAVAGDTTCRPVGVAACGIGMRSDGRGGCTADLPPMPCAAGLVALPGETSCHEVADCGSDPFGAPPSDAPILYVDSAAPAGGDGTRTRPFAKIADAISRATASSTTTVAVAAGTYDGELVIDRPVHPAVGTRRQRPDERHRCALTAHDHGLLAGTKHRARRGYVRRHAGARSERHSRHPAAGRRRARPRRGDTGRRSGLDFMRDRTRP